MRLGGAALNTISWKPVTGPERLKYEAAEELGLLEKLVQVGWGGLSARETGLIGARVRGQGK
jgi:hypothetical protein